MAGKIALVCIDPQYDFCAPDGSLSVKGADKDCQRLAVMVKRLKDKISHISVTLDSHRVLHIAHPIWWTDSKGSQPNPFTLIGLKDVVGDNPKWRARVPSLQKWSEKYLFELDKSGRHCPVDADGNHVLCVWPPHCLIGSNGYKVQPVLFDALVEWEKQLRGRICINWVTKGSNPKTEHYSAVRADVKDDDDPETDMNVNFVKMIEDFETIIFAGEALSHCLASTFTDIVEYFGDEFVKKCILLEDATSSVGGFEFLGDTFLNTMKPKGLRVMKTTDFLP